MLIANASKLNTTCSITSSQLTKLDLNGTYSGRLFNAPGSAALDTITIYFTTDDTTTPHTITQAEFSANTVGTPSQIKVGGGIPMTLADGSLAGKSNSELMKPHDVTTFSISTNDKKDNTGNVVILQFLTTVGNNKSISGVWKVINTGSAYDNFSGKFTLTQSSNN
jgi:hypothetical protein